jgi:hypothetical protein
MCSTASNALPRRIPGLRQGMWKLLLQVKLEEDSRQDQQQRDEQPE